ncbi:FecR family protein [Chitinophaga sancti]|uniref:FecR domain-containing protein n=1 Tax=Chitinophaga sancti TaxID=1004 RepID=A0A1K1PXA4_9BACT|nr:FecR family protein [Chitinophaga sancti]WQD61518.1 FecR domain-containing protein [Chitinophaga sancti]WQG92925.1 FecR domain-containing protein [Chitinophaga sancti]SFW52378.1 FecR family protein [Chitinophaga sancti]
MSIDRITALLEKLTSNTCTWQEKKELFALIDSVDDPQLKAVLEAAWQKYNEPVHNLSDATSRVILSNILKKDKPTRVLSIRKWRVAAVAAAAALLIGFSIYKFTGAPSTTAPAIAIVSDIKAPAIHKATITLSNGQQVPADSIANGQLVMQGQTKVIRLSNGEIVYQAQGQHNEIILNTLTNPKGSQVASITLSDGSHVWLNAGSTLTYPVAFSGKERKVTVTGEAYFEVAPAGDHKIPFLVNIKTNQRDSSLVTVLGTHFNIKAYEDEADTRVTLLQGSVQVDHLQQGLRIVPGQQARYAEGKQILVSTAASVDDVVAWKEGFFAYQNSNMSQVLRDVARWYDIDVVYTGNKVPNDTFTGEIPRTVTLTELLQILKMSRVNFRIEGRQLTVLN